jgi:hypothetical protein
VSSEKASGLRSSSTRRFVCFRGKNMKNLKLANFFFPCQQQTSRENLKKQTDRLSSDGRKAVPGYLAQQATYTKIQFRVSIANFGEIVFLRLVVDKLRNFFFKKNISVAAKISRKSPRTDGYPFYTMFKKQCLDTLQNKQFLRRFSFGLRQRTSEK